MPHPRRRWNPMLAIGGSLTVLAVGAFLVSRFTSGRLAWLNAYGQLVTVYSFLSVLVIIAVLGLLDLFVWRRQRRNRPPTKSSRKDRY